MYNGRGERVGADSSLCAFGVLLLFPSAEDAPEQTFRHHSLRVASRRYSWMLTAYSSILRGEFPVALSGALRKLESTAC